MDSKPFPLASWFDITKPITKSVADDVEEQLIFYAYKDDINFTGPELKSVVQAMRQAVNVHNRTFEADSNTTTPKKPKTPGQKARRLLSRGHTVEVTFIKADGTQRVMQCTRNPEMISEGVKGHIQKGKKPINEAVIRVFDVEIQAWRSFDVNSVISYRCL